MIIIIIIKTPAMIRIEEILVYYIISLDFSVPPPIKQENAQK